VKVCLSIRIQLHESPLEKLWIKFKLEVVGGIGDREIEYAFGSFARRVNQIDFFDFVIAFVPTHRVGNDAVVFERDDDVDWVVEKFVHRGRVRRVRRGRRVRMFWIQRTFDSKYSAQLAWHGAGWCADAECADF